MKLDKHFAAAASILLVAAGLIGVTWRVTGRWIRAEHAARLRHVERLVDDQAVQVAGRINRQILAVDQTLRMMATAWRADPAGFRLETWRREAVVLDGLNWQMLMTDAHGTVRQASAADAINLNAAGMDYFRALASPSAAPDTLYIGPAAIDDVMRQWHLNIARPLHRPDGSFAGVIDADYRLDAITNALGGADLGTDKFAALVGLHDGRLRAAIGATGAGPGVAINGTPMLAAMRKASQGVWIGPSAPDTVVRVQAFDRLPGRNLAVVVGMDLRDAMRPSGVFQRRMRLVAIALSLVILALAVALVQGTRLARRRNAQALADQAERAATDARAAVAVASAEAMAAQLETALVGIPDGVGVFDAQLCLATWNPRFAELAGVPPGILRVGLPFEELTRQQIANSQLGPVANPAQELRRRMDQFRAAPAGVTEWTRPDGITLRVRHRGLPNGGFVTLYADITDRQQAEETQRQALAAAEAAKADKARFATLASDECREPLDEIRRMLDRLHETARDMRAGDLLTRAQAACDQLSEVIDAIQDLARLETGTLVLQPRLTDIRALAEDSVAACARRAAQTGRSIVLTISENAPETLFGDPARLRQLLVNLLAQALGDTGPRTIRLTIAPGQRAEDALCITVPDARPLPGSPADMDLARAITRHLVTLMGGRIGYEASQQDNDAPANLLRVALPVAMLPYRPAASGTQDRAADTRPSAVPPRGLPRCHILLAADHAAQAEVIAGILRREGHAVQTASLDSSGLALLRDQPFELVFIDAGASPEDRTAADSFALLIRQLPPPGGLVPLIAVVGHAALPGGPDGDTAIYDASITRPLSLPELNAQIHRLVWHRRVPRPPTVPASVSASARDAEPPVIVADRIRELRTMYPAEEFAAQVEETLVTIDRQMPALRRALRSRAGGQIAVHANALASVAAGYGMLRLEARLRGILSAVREGDLTKLDDTAVSELQAEIEAAKHALRAFSSAEPT